MLLVNADADVTITGVASPPPVVPFWFMPFTDAHPMSALAGGGVAQPPAPVVPPLPALPPPVPPRPPAPAAPPPLPAAPPRPPAPPPPVPAALPPPVPPRPPAPAAPPPVPALPPAAPPV